MLTDGTVVTVRTLPTVVVADGSGKAAQKVSDLKTVGDLLKAQNIKVGKDDVVTPSVGTMLRQGLRITITRVGYRLVTKTQVVVQPPTNRCRTPRWTRERHRWPSRVRPAQSRLPTG